MKAKKIVRVKSMWNKLLFLFSVPFMVPVLAATVGPEKVSILELNIKSQESTGGLRLNNVPRPSRNDVLAFYHNREYQFAWSKNGNPIAGAWELLNIVRNSDKEGLEPTDYPIDSLERLLHQGKKNFFWRTQLDPGVATNLDLLLSKTYLTIANHILFGRTQPKTSDDRWHISPEPINLPSYLQATLSESQNVGESLRRLAPLQPEYGKMKYWLTTYRLRLLQGPWDLVTDMSSPGVDRKINARRVLCLRLQGEGYADAIACQDTTSPELGQGLKRFQSTHGLPDLGSMDNATLKELNVTIQQRIDQIKLNLDCWRWLPQILGKNHIRINIADFRLGAFEQGIQVFSMKVVVGRKSDSTPVFSDRAIAVTINPPWNVPGSIAKEELLPELKKDPNYLAKHDMELLADWTKEDFVLKADSIDWSKVDSSHFNFKIRQKYGESSALGRLKINLTNPFNIYLHDTPSKKYFDREKRALSHGCVRLEEPLKLAEWLLGPGSHWTEDKLRSEIAKGEPYTIAIQEPGIPIHILYRTAFVDPEGGLQFRPDIYGWDTRLGRDLKTASITP